MGDGIMGVMQVEGDIAQYDTKTKLDDLTESIKKEGGYSLLIITNILTVRNE